MTTVFCVVDVILKEHLNSNNAPTTMEFAQEKKRENISIRIRFLNKMN